MKDQLKNKIIMAQKNKTPNKWEECLSLGELVEDYCELMVPAWGTKLPIDHPSGFDYYWEDKKAFIDVKTCLASHYGGNVFIEHVQNLNHGGLANHYKVEMDDDKHYWLFYFDVTERGFGNWWCFDVRKLRELLKDSSHSVRGGYNASGDLLHAPSTAGAKGRW
jgi:hypothetical protein